MDKIKVKIISDVVANKIHKSSGAASKIDMTKLPDAYQQTLLITTKGIELNGSGLATGITISGSVSATESTIKVTDFKYLETSLIKFFMVALRNMVNKGGEQDTLFKELNDDSKKNKHGRNIFGR